MLPSSALVACQATQPGRPSRTLLPLLMVSSICFCLLPPGTPVSLGRTVCVLLLLVKGAVMLPACSWVGRLGRWVDDRGLASWTGGWN